MPSIKQTEYCTVCKRTVTSDSAGMCKICGNKVDKGNWTARFRIIEEGEYKNKALSGYATKKEANQGYIDFMAEYDATQKVLSPSEKNINHMTVQELYMLYKAHIAHNIKESSLLVREARIEQFVLPYFQSHKVGQITVADIAQWKATINNISFGNEKKAYSWKYKTSIHSAFLNLLNFAKKYYGLRDNVVSIEGDFSKREEIKKDMLFWTPQEFKKFYRFVKEIENISTKENQIVIKKLRLFILTAYLCGCRKGENAALTWQDINFTNNTIDFKKTASRRNKDGVYKITSPKTKNSYRTNDMPQYYMDELYTYKLEEKRRVDFLEQDFIWYGKKVIPEQTVYNYFTKWVSLSGVKKIRIHDLRHSCVSLLLNTVGYDLSMLYVIANRIGDTPEQILQTYGHMFPSKKDEVLKVLNDTIF